VILPDYISFTRKPHESLLELIETLKPDKVGYLVDEHTREHCLPLLRLPKEAFVIEIKSGEINKNLDSCGLIWSALTDEGFSRKSLLINVGGGVIGDMGGFAASTYKRGIRFINFPTTLLAAVDANIGGKLGIDFNGFKNHIGVFNDPSAVVICDLFLETLPDRELRSGYAEVIKHGLIFDKDYFEEIRNATFPELDWQKVIEKSAEIKSEVVEKDPREQGLRKILNFGHTLGHGVETWALNHEKSLLHGEAIAIGMILEGFLSFKKSMLTETDLHLISIFLVNLYGKEELPPLDEVMALVAHDKKNVGSNISFSLIKGIGNCSFDEHAESEWISESFDFYKSLK
jgi:3-dehydroquinate synthase